MANLIDSTVNILDSFGAPWISDFPYPKGMIIIQEGMMYKALKDNMNEVPSINSNYWLWIPSETYHSVENNTTVIVPWTDNKMIVPMFDVETLTSPCFKRKSETEIEILHDMPMCHIEGWVHLNSGSQRESWEARVLVDGNASNKSRLQLSSYIRGTANQNITGGVPNFIHGQVFNYNGVLSVGQILTVEIILAGRSTVSSTTTVSGRCFWNAIGKV